MKRKPIKWYWLMLSQFAGLMLVGALVIFLALSLPDPWSGAVYRAAMWGALPALSALSAFWVTRRGLNFYIAWLAAPICQTAAHWLLTGYPPSSAGMPLVGALLSIVAAATAETIREREARRKK